MEEIIYEKEIKNSGFELPKNNEEYFFMCKISIIFQKKEIYGSGFFIKLNKNNRPLYCLMTNEHIIQKEMINSNQIQMINISYDNYQKERNIILNKNERFIKEFTFMNLDITIIEILQKDNINFNNFLITEKIKEDYSQYKNKKILIPQFPHGGQLYYSIGIINEVNQNDYFFSHLSSTSKGSSGSPIFLYDELKFKYKLVIIGIHCAQYRFKEENYGNFIEPIIQYLNNNNRIYVNKKNNNIEYICGENYYKGEIINEMPNGKGNLYNKDNILIFSGRFKDGKKIGFGTEYFNNKKIKYKGNFYNDKYDGLGILYYFEGSYYKGMFKNGLRHGKGAVYNERNKLVHMGFFENGDYIGDSPYRNGNYGFEDDDNVLNKTIMYVRKNPLKLEPIKTLHRVNSNYNLYMKTI